MPFYISDSVTPKAQTLALEVTNNMQYAIDQYHKGEDGLPSI